MKRIAILIFIMLVFAGSLSSQSATDIRLLFYDTSDSTWVAANGTPVENTAWGFGVLARAHNYNGTSWQPVPFGSVDTSKSGDSLIVIIGKLRLAIKADTTVLP